MQYNTNKITCLIAILLLVFCCPAEAKSVEVRGTPGSVEAGSSMLLDGFNFPELFYRIKDNNTYEWLNISFAANGTIDKSDASYKTKVYSNDRCIMFMGTKYYSLDSEKANILSKKYSTGWTNSKKVFQIGEVYEFPEGYTLTVLDIDQNSKKATIQLAKDGKVVENSIVETGNTFIYDTDIENAKDIKIFTCKVDAVMGGTDSNIVILKSVKHYSDKPLVLETGDKFGDFEITSITNITIEMKNSKTISCSLDRSVDLIGDWLDLKVSEDDYWGYVYTTKTLECPTTSKVSTVTELVSSSPAGQNDTASNTSGDSKTNSTVTAIPSAAPTTTPNNTSIVTPVTTPDATPINTSTVATEQSVTLASAGGAGIEPLALSAIGIAPVLGLFTILVLIMNIRRNSK